MDSMDGKEQVCKLGTRRSSTRVAVEVTGDSETDETAKSGTSRR